MAALHHNDSETPSLLKTLQPYSYDGCWPTTCRLKKSSMLHLTFIVNRKWANVSLTLETIRPWVAELGESESLPTVSDLTLQSEGSGTISNGDLHGSHVNQPSSKMLMGNYTIMFVISGAIHVKLSGSEQAASVSEGETLVCKRPDMVAPADISMTPISFNGHVSGMLQTSFSPFNAISTMAP